MENYSLNLGDLLRSTSGVALGVLVILFLISVLSWGIIFEKLWVFARAKRARRLLQDLSLDRLDLENLRLRLARHAKSPLSRVYQHLYLNYFSAHQRDEEALTRLLSSSGTAELARLEARLGILASAGSVSPFIGLFGTVWGVMRSFMNIGGFGSTSLAVVAPGIAEALIATAAGLVAAIPAVIAYNAFLGMLREESRALEQFSTDLILAERRRLSNPAVAASARQL